MTVPTQYHVRWATPRDMPALLKIEKSVFSDPWSEHDFLTGMRRRNVITMVANAGSDFEPLGYVMYEVRRDSVVILNFAVAPGHKRKGIGRALAAKLRYKVIAHRRDRAELVVHEENAAMHAFLAAVGYRATGVSWGHYCDPDGANRDGYMFVMRPTDEERRALGFGLLASGEIVSGE